MLDTLTSYGDSLMTHGTLPRMGSAAAFVPQQDMWVGTVLMVCVVAVLLALAGESRGLKVKLMSLAAPAGSRAAQEAAMAQVTAAERWRTVLFLILQAVSLGVLHMSWMWAHNPSFCGIWLPGWDVVVTPVILLGGSMVLCMVVFGLQRLLYQWIHVTFFAHDALMRWRLAYRLSMAAGAAFLVVSACAVGSDEIAAEWAVHCSILSAILVKMGLLWCAWHVFFVKARTILHFFAYLCSAELVPLAVLWLLLGALTHLLTV